jgi:hypothetical protein
MPQSGREGQFLFLQAKCLKLQTFQAPKIINCLHRLFVCLIVVVIMLNLSQKMVKKHKCCSFYFYCQTYFVMLRHGCYIVTCNLFGDCRLLRPPYVKILAPPLTAAEGTRAETRTETLARRRDQDDVPGERMKRRFHAGRRRSKTFEDGDEATYVGDVRVPSNLQF